MVFWYLEIFSFLYSNCFYLFCCLSCYLDVDSLYDGDCILLTIGRRRMFMDFRMSIHFWWQRIVGCKWYSDSFREEFIISLFLRCEAFVICNFVFFIRVLVIEQVIHFCVRNRDRQCKLSFGTNRKNAKQFTFLKKHT